MGREANWMSVDPEVQVQNIGSRWSQAGRVVVTQLCLGVLIISSAVENVAYAAFRLFTMLYSPINDTPEKFIQKLQTSSFITLLWSIGDFAYYNIFVINVLTHENMVVQSLMPCRSSSPYTMPTDAEYHIWG